MIDPTPVLDQMYDAPPPLAILDPRKLCAVVFVGDVPVVGSRRMIRRDRGFGGRFAIAAC